MANSCNDLVIGVKSEEGSCDWMVDDEDDDQEKVVEETLGGEAEKFSIEEKQSLQKGLLALPYLQSIKYKVIK